MVQYRFQSLILNRIRQPATLIQGLSKIGGLLVIAKITILIKLLHEYLFERQLVKDLNQIESHQINDSEANLRGSDINASFQGQSDQQKLIQKNDRYKSVDEMRQNFSFERFQEMQYQISQMQWQLSKVMQEKGKQLGKEE